MVKIQEIQCPFCKSTIEVDIEWAIKNGLVFCPCCCKSFPVSVGDEEF